MPGPGPYLSLADGWDEQARDLRRRAVNLGARVAAIRNGSKSLVDPAELEAAADRNVITATTLEVAARQLRQHHDAVTHYAAAKTEGRTT